MDLFQFLQEQDIAYQRCDHPPVFTCQEASELVPPLPGAKTKNLFLRDGKGRRHFLVSLGQDKIVDLKGLAAELGVGKLGFASNRRLQSYLGITPGSVTMLSLINDPEHRVELIIDEDLWQAEAFQCHPLVNTSTLVLKKSDLIRFFERTGHRYSLCFIPQKHVQCEV